MDRFKILKNTDMKARSASMSFEDFQRKIEDQRREAAAQKLSPQQRQSNELIRHHLSTSEGRQRIANDLITPIQRQLDFTSIARRIFRVDHFPGIFPIYERAENSSTFMVDVEGSNVVPVTTGSRVVIPTFEISSHPEIPLSQIRNNRFELIDRAQNQAVQRISSTESLLSYNILNTVTTRTNQIIRPVEFNTPESILNTFRDAFASIERSELRVARILSNRFDYFDYSIIQNNLNDNLDQTTHDELRASGVMGSLWGAQIITNQNIPQGEIFVTSEPEQLGVMPIRSDITVLSADDPSRAMLGWSIFEEVGMGCLNLNAVTRISLTQEVSEPPRYGESIIQRAMPQLLKLRSRFELLKQGA
jgi:hypothetical protein